MLKKVIRDLIFIIILVALPATILLNAYSSKNGFLDLIFFGEEFSVNRLKVIKSIDLSTQTRFGYDGQFYAQVALDPLLIHNDTIRALDNPVFRARRIGLPFLSFILGFGNPIWVLQVYALLNFAFWGLLLLLLYQYFGFRSYRDFLLIISVLWSTGTLVSLCRALPDLPTATLSVLAVFLISKRNIAASLLSFATLCKETLGLSIFLLIWPDKKGKIKPYKIILSCLIVIIPIAIWVIYLKFRINENSFLGINNFAFPFSGIILKEIAGSVRFFKALPQFRTYDMINLSYELICPLSLLAQSLYLLFKPRTYLPFWRLGIGFAVFIYLLGQDMWVEQESYCRTLLILTFCFNFLIHKYEQGISYTLWYFIGNIGMSWIFIKVVSKLVFNFPT